MVVEYDCDHCVREAHVVDAQPQCQATEEQNTRLFPGRHKSIKEDGASVRSEGKHELRWELVAYYIFFPIMVVEYDCDHCVCGI